MFRAMEFTEVDVQDVGPYLADQRYVAQQKMDGTRVLIRRTQEGKYTAYQRSGKPLGHTAATQHLEAVYEGLEQAFDGKSVEVVLDGELLIDKGTYHIFDLPIVHGRDPGAYWMRMMALDFLMKPNERIHRVRSHARSKKERLLESCRLAGVEGVMFKHLHERYQPGERVTHSVKVKFVKTADVVVMASTRSRNEAGREVGAFAFGVYDENGEFLTIGSCSAIGKPHTEVGDVIEVAYLYWTGASLVQPRMIQVRPDKKPWDCTTMQFPTYSREVVK